MIKTASILASGTLARLYFSSLVMLGALLYGSTSSAQGSKPEEMQFSIFNEAITIPTKSPIWKTNLPKHIGFSAGANWYYKNSGKNYYFVNTSMQLFTHQYMYTGLQLLGSWNYRRTFSPYFNVGFEAGFGYFHRFPYTREYRVKDGEYRQIRKLGIPSIMFTFGAQMNWYPKNFFKSGSFFLKYQLQGFYQFSDVVQVLPMTLTHVGISYPFEKLFRPKDQ